MTYTTFSASLLRKEDVVQEKLLALTREQTIMLHDFKLGDVQEHCTNKCTVQPPAFTDPCERITPR